MVLDLELQEDEGGMLTYLRELLRLEQYEVFVEHQPGDPVDGYHFQINLPNPSGSSSHQDDYGSVTADGPGRAEAKYVLFYPRSSMDAAERRARADRGDPGEAAAAELLAMAAEALGTDFLVTNRAPLVGAKWRHRGNPVTPAEALTVIGLHMRVAGTVTVRASETFRSQVDTNWAELVQAWTLLPDVKEAVSHAPNNEPWAQLLRETVYRTGQMLRARDRVLLASTEFYEKHQVDVENEVERLALAGMSAFDIVARATNIALGLGLDAQQCSLRYNKYQNALAKVDPMTAAKLDDLTTAATIELVSGLRNTIHGEPLRPVGYSGSNTRQAVPRVLIPSDTTKRVHDAAKTLGKHKSWINDFGPYGILIHPQRVANDLIILTVQAVNALVGSIKWPLDPESQGWPRTDPHDPFEPRNAQRINWLYGL
ncbi:hypothetical protein [Jiangella rhizosphaerae]|uniref:hypothetical protein n=1 Tax=Jiangella rhizosphaerae TaxID=2293569 RepID=UPI0011C3B480|nr:hypothetical protein [Jiangella rhizosphaerae]